MREQAFTVIENHFKQTNVLFDEIQQLVGKEDLLFSLIEPLMVQYAKFFAEIKKMVDKGKRVSELPIDALMLDKPQC